jgi:hypothetical protein
MDLKGLIHSEVVLPALRERLHPIRAVVVGYNNYNNTANVRYLDPEGGGERELARVPIQIGSGGVHSAGPFPGDEVWVNFLGGSAMYPRIVALADEDYQEKTRAKLKHERQGSLVPNKITKALED